MYTMKAAWTPKLRTVVEWKALWPCCTLRRSPSPVHGQSLAPRGPGTPRKQQRSRGAILEVRTSRHVQECCARNPAIQYIQNERSTRATAHHRPRDNSSTHNRRTIVASQGARSKCLIRMALHEAKLIFSCVTAVLVAQRQNVSPTRAPRLRAATPRALSVRYPKGKLGGTSLCQKPRGPKGQKHLVATSCSWCELTVQLAVTLVPIHNATREPLFISGCEGETFLQPQLMGYPEDDVLFVQPHLSCRDAREPARSICKRLYKDRVHHCQSPSILSRSNHLVEVAAVINA